MFNKTLKLLVIFLLVGGVTFFFPRVVRAETCSDVTPAKTSLDLISTACSFSGDANGIDDGWIKASTGATLTILAGQTINALSFILNGGSVVIIATGNLTLGSHIWMIDADVDTYAANTTQYVQASSPANGVLRSTIASLTTTDCYDSNATAKPGQTSYYTTNRGDGSFDYDCDGATTKRRLSCTDPTCANSCSVTCPYIDATAEATACGTTGINAGFASATTNNDEYGACVSCTGSGTTFTTMECR